MKHAIIREAGLFATLGLAALCTHVGAYGAIVPFSEGFESYAGGATDLSPLTTTVSHGNVTLQVDEDAVNAYAGDNYLTIGWNASTGVVGTSLARVPSAQFRTNSDPAQYTISYVVNVASTDLSGGTSNVGGNAHFVLKDASDVAMVYVEMLNTNGTKSISVGGSSATLVNDVWLQVSIDVDETAGTYGVDIVNTSNSQSILSLTGLSLGGSGAADNFYVAGGQFPNSGPGALFRYDEVSVVVPEPASLALTGLGLLMVGRRGRAATGRRS